MANRRLMGMGNRSGNRSFSQQPFQGNVNPWQGNMSNDINQGFMNPLSNPQQLALAITSLLQPQQQPMNNPPSLLSLNAAPAYNQDRDLGRFGNRGRSDFRRPEPYNKNNRGGWRDHQQGRNRNKNQNKNKNVTPKKADEKKKEEKKQNDSVDLSTDEGEDEKKRDWKEEKNTVDENQDQEMKDENEESKKNKDKEGKFFGIPQHLLHCFVCSKDMWDGESFEKHVKGRAHKQMLESLEESMSITVSILRENMRLAEEKKLIELNRMQRLNKKPIRNKFADVESHCNMCDFKFLGKIISHRKSEGHQRLKRFLHPNCNMCVKEFPSRMEWVEHRLSPEHLRELAKFMEENNKSDGAEVVFKDEDDSEFDLEPLMEEVTEQEDDFPIVELDDDLHDLQNRIPAYRKTRLLGSKSLVPFTGFLCQICNTSFPSEELAQNHLKLRKHYLKFVEAAKNKYQKQLQEEKEEKEKAEKTEQEEEMKDGKEEDGDDANEENADNSQDVNDSDMYDPEEACTEEIEKEKDDDLKPNGDKPATEVKVELEKTVEAKEQNISITEEEAKPAGQNTPARPKRQSTTNVKNGAGPKSKKAKK